jgi:hypothetical protein
MITILKNRRIIVTYSVGPKISDLVDQEHTMLRDWCPECDPRVDSAMFSVNRHGDVGYRISIKHSNVRSVWVNALDVINHDDDYSVPSIPSPDVLL